MDTIFNIMQVEVYVLFLRGKKKKKFLDVYYI